MRFIHEPLARAIWVTMPHVKTLNFDYYYYYSSVSAFVTPPFVLCLPNTSKESHCGSRDNSYGSSHTRHIRYGCGLPEGSKKPIWVWFLLFLPLPHYSPVGNERFNCSVDSTYSDFRGNYTISLFVLHFLTALTHPRREGCLNQIEQRKT